jgi:hypothetical protein
MFYRFCFVLDSVAEPRNYSFQLRLQAAAAPGLTTASGNRENNLLSEKKFITFL